MTGRQTSFCFCQQLRLAIGCCIFARSFLFCFCGFSVSILFQFELFASFLEPLSHFLHSGSQDLQLLFPFDPLALGFLLIRILQFSKLILTLLNHLAKLSKPQLLPLQLRFQRLGL